MVCAYIDNTNLSRKIEKAMRENINFIRKKWLASSKKCVNMPKG